MSRPTLTHARASGRLPPSPGRASDAPVLFTRPRLDAAERRRKKPHSTSSHTEHTACAARKGSGAHPGPSAARRGRSRLEARLYYRVARGGGHGARGAAWRAIREIRAIDQLILFDDRKDVRARSPTRLGSVERQEADALPGPENGRARAGGGGGGGAVAARKAVRLVACAGAPSTLASPRGALMHYEGMTQDQGDLIAARVVRDA